MQKTKFFLGGMLILAAVVYLIFSSTQASAEYFLTVDEIHAEGAAAVDKSVRLSGAVLASIRTDDTDVGYISEPEVIDHAQRHGRNFDHQRTIMQVDPDPCVGRGGVRRQEN